MKQGSSKLTFDFCEIVLTKDGLFHIDIFPNSNIGKTEVISIVDAMLKLSKGEILPALILMGEFTEISKEAREFTADPKRPLAANALAFVLNNSGHRIIANFFMALNKPVKPVRFFKKEKEALLWLNQFKLKKSFYLDNIEV